MDDGNVSAGIEIRHVEALRDRLRDVAQEDTFFLHRVIRRHARSRVLDRQIVQGVQHLSTGLRPSGLRGRPTQAETHFSRAI